MPPASRNHGASDATPDSDIARPATMKIVRTRVMRGPNYWSVTHHKLVVVDLELEAPAGQPDEWIGVLRERLVAVFPGIGRQRALAAPQGRLRVEARIGRLVAGSALELQRRAGMRVAFGGARVVGNSGVCEVFFEYREEEAGLHAGECAVRMAQALSAGQEYGPSEDLATIRKLGDLARLDPGLEALVAEAGRRGIAVFKRKDRRVLQFGCGAAQRQVWRGSAGDEGDGGGGPGPTPVCHPPEMSASGFLDRLFPAATATRVPIIAVTGTNGKTTTSRLIAHIFGRNGRVVGQAMTDGVFIAGRLRVEGDCAGPGSAEYVLLDPAVEVAVLETARGGLLRSGLGYARCDVGIVTNVAADHLGLGGIPGIGEMARLKAVVPKAVHAHGYAILNADDARVLRMGAGLKCRVALFSLDEGNPAIRQHLDRGGICAVRENGYITLCEGSARVRVAKVADAPLTMGGRAVFMIQNILPAVIAAHVSGIGPAEIGAALESFAPSVSQTPGRLNRFAFRRFTVLLDFAHNVAGFRALRDVVDQMDGAPKVGIIAGLGDRRRSDNMEMGSIAAGMFDEIILRQDMDLRGRTGAEILGMVRAGIARVKPDMPVTVIPDEEAAIRHGIRTAAKGSLLVACCGCVKAAVELVVRLQQEDDNA